MPVVAYILERFPVLSETFILNELLALESRGVEVHVFSLGPPEDARPHEALAQLQAAITYLPRRSAPVWMWSQQIRAAARFRTSYVAALVDAARSRQPRAWWRFLQAVWIANQFEREGVRHIHSHYANEPSTVASFASRITGIPYSFTAHAWDIYRSRYMTPRSLRGLARRIKRSRCTITVSDFNKAYLERVAPSASAKILRLYNGIDLERFAPNSQPEPPPHILLSVCRLVEKKGLSVLVEACRVLRDRGVAFEAWIVGAGKLHAALEAQIRAGRLDEHVSLLGPHTQRETLARYHSAHLFVLPCLTAADGDHDGLPVSIVEALACGLPVVTTPVAGIPEVVRHGHNGLLVPEGNSGALADAVESLIRDETLYGRLRANARASVEQTFDIRRTSEQLERSFRGEW